MQLTTILSAALLSSLSIAAPFKTLSKSKPNPALTWHVSNFNTHCSPDSDCLYTFHIAGLGTANTPGFNTTCAGVTGKDSYQPCHNPQVSAIVDSEHLPLWSVDVQHTWIKGEAQFWADGSANATAPSKRFDITVDEQYGVA